MTYAFFKMNKQKFHEECHVVACVKTMPDCKEQKGGNMADAFVVEKLETLVDVLEYP